MATTKQVDYTDLHRLLGKKFEDSIVTSFCGKLGSFEEKRYSNNDCFRNFKQNGISIFLDGKTSKIQTIFLYNEGKDGFQKFKGELPLNLTMSMTSSDVVRLLGEPDRKGGPPLIGVWISYESKGVQIEFKNKTWEDKLNPIELISIFLPE